MEMGKFKLVAALIIIMLFIVGPIGLLFVPSWNTKLNPMLNLVNVLLGEGAEDKILLGGFAFVDSDEDSLTIRLDLGINNTDGPELLFPAVNLTFKYGNGDLGYGWISEAVTIPADSEDVTVPIYARMYKGDPFNQFMLSLVSGGLAISVSSAEVFIFLETFGGIPAGELSIPLPSLPLPAIEFGDVAYPPTCHAFSRGNVTANQPVVITANVSDRGGGVGEVILSWSANGSAWQNITIDESQLPQKDLFGGHDTLLGDAMNTAFPNYPNSTIPTSWAPATVSANISPYSVGTEVKYRLYVVDVYNHTSIIPSEDPLNESGKPSDDSYNTTEHWFEYTVTSGELDTYIASWEEYGAKMKTTQDGAGDMMSDLFASLEESGIDLFGALIAGSSAFAEIMEMELTIDNIINISVILLDLLQPLIEYMHTKGVNPFELLDQLLGLSGGIPGVDPVVRDNVNASIGMDMLMESGVGLDSLLLFLDVNLSVVVDELGNSIVPPLAGGDTLSEALFNLLDATRASPAENASFFAFLDDKDAHYIDLPFHVFRTDSSDTVLGDFSIGAGNSTPDDVPFDCNVGDRFYFGSPMEAPLTGGDPVTVSNFTAIRFDMGSTTNDPVEGITFVWEYYDGVSWTSLPVLLDETANLNNSGRVIFSLPADHQLYDLPGILGYPNHWIRMRITDNGTAGYEPVATMVRRAENFVPYYMEVIAVDMFGRPTADLIPGETDSYANLLATMNASNGYALLIWQILDEKNVAFDDLLEELEGSYMSIPGPVTGADILAASTPIMAMLVYGILLLGLVAAMRGRKGTYAISQGRVKKWYGTMVVTPSLKTREEVEKYKMK